MQPLAERMRPQTLDDYVGQDHLVGEKAVCAELLRLGGFLPLFYGDLQGLVKLPWQVSLLKLLSAFSYTFCY